MKKLLLILAATVALCDPASAQSITANQFPGFGTVAGTAIQGPGVLGAATGTSLALGGATIGTDALGVTGTSSFSSTVTFAGQLGVNIGGSWRLIASAASATVPTIIPNTGSTTTGIGSQANGNMSMVVGGAENTRFSTNIVTLLGTTQLNVATMTQTSAAQSGTNCYNSATGAMTYDATLGCLTSLEETKNIQPGGIPQALPEIMALKPFWFTWKDKKLHRDTNQQPGLGAHATEKVDARLVGYGPDGKLRGVRYTEMVALLVAAIQQQQAEIASLGPMRQCKNLYIRRLVCW